MMLAAYFNGGYVPAGASSMIRVTIWAEPKVGPRDLCLWLRWDDSSGAQTELHRNCDASVCVTVSNLRLLAPTDICVDLGAIGAFSWIARALKPLQFTGQSTVLFDSPASLQVWAQYGGYLAPSDLLEKAA
jgi:hypothetical protein